MSIDFASLKEAWDSVGGFLDTPLGKITLALLGAGSGYAARAIQDYYANREALGLINDNKGREDDLVFSRTLLMKTGEKDNNGNDLYDVVLENAFGHIRGGETPKISRVDLFGGGHVGKILAGHCAEAGKQTTEENPITVLRLKSLLQIKGYDENEIKSVLTRMDTEARDFLSGILRGSDTDAFFADERQGHHKRQEMLAVIVDEPWPKADKSDDTKSGAFSDRHRLQTRVLLVPTWQLEPENIVKLQNSLRFRMANGDFETCEGHHRHKQRIKTLLAIAEAWQRPEDREILAKFLISKTTLSAQSVPTVPQPVQRPA